MDATSNGVGSTMRARPYQAIVPSDGNDDRHAEQRQRYMGDGQPAGHRAAPPERQGSSHCSKREKIAFMTKPASPKQAIEAMTAETS